MRFLPRCEERQSVRWYLTDQNLGRDRTGEINSLLFCFLRVSLNFSNLSHLAIHVANFLILVYP